MRSMKARRLNLLRAWLITLLLSVAAAIGGYAWESLWAASQDRAMDSVVWVRSSELFVVSGQG